MDYPRRGNHRWAPERADVTRQKPMADNQAVNRHWSEDLALQQLLASGLKLVCRNYWTRRGEIDLVMRDGNELVFVEVRQRTNTAYGRPEETVNRSKRARLRLAAGHFLQQYA